MPPYVVVAALSVHARVAHTPLHSSPTPRRTQTDADFELPPPWSHEACERVVGGWPYLHLWSHYLRV